jgi:hypothetical protein
VTPLLKRVYEDPSWRKMYLGPPKHCLFQETLLVNWSRNRSVPISSDKSSNLSPGE